MSDIAVADPALDATTSRARTHLIVWFLSGAALTFVILVIGGITRLTLSGLSIVDWHPVIGVIPPLNEAQWQEAFDRYRQFPEYQQLRRGMSLEEFRFIFFWEYLHRMAARLIGLVFLVPFLVFWARGYLDRPLMKRALLLFALGALQGFMGWFMVRSGLVDQPHVSHYRLAAHLAIAFAIFGCCIWFALELRGGVAAAWRREARAFATRGLWVLGALLCLQIVWGAFVAGLKAGFVFNTFPLMGGGLVPPRLLALEPVWRNVVENAVTVQWLHRLLGTVLGCFAIWFAVASRGRGLDPAVQRLHLLLAAAILSQYALGVLTLLMRVPVSLGVAHQAAAMLIFGLWLVCLHNAIGRPTEEGRPRERELAAAG